MNDKTQQFIDFLLGEGEFPFGHWEEVEMPITKEEYEN